MADVIVFGTGQSAEVAYYYLTHDSPHHVVAFTVDAAYLGDTSLFGLPVVAFDEVEHMFSPTKYSMLVPIAYTRVNRLRAERYAAAKDKGYSLITYVSSRASTWETLRIGDNCTIDELVSIQPFSTIGDDVVIGPGSSIGHHVTIGDHVYIASQVAISGHVTIGEYSFLGANATVRDGVVIGPENVIGAHVVIVRDTLAREVYASARPQRLPLPSDKLPRI